jgi:hypothetical protein
LVAIYPRIRYAPFLEEQGLVVRLTICDARDTMHSMGIPQILDAARTLVETGLNKYGYECALLYIHLLLILSSVQM